MPLTEFLSNLLSNEERGPELEAAADLRVTAEALAVALAADRIKGDPRVARATEAFLEEQTLLLKAQRDEIAESGHLRLAQMRSQMRESQLRYVGHRIRVVVQAFFVLFLGIIGLSLAGMVYQAATSRSVVVDAFKAPPALAARGVTGEVVAADVLDALQELQAATRASTAALDARGAWAGDIKIEVPKTGISIGEVSRLLHDRLGHDVHIDGDLTEDAAGGLTLTVRGDGIPAASFTGDPEELEKLPILAAEYVYSRSQPYRYGVYLEDVGRARDALAFLPGALSRATDDEHRARLADIWGNAYTALLENAAAAGKYRLAMTFSQPRSQYWWLVWDNLIGAIEVSEGEEAGWRESQAFEKVVGATPKRMRPDALLQSNLAQVTWDVSFELQSLLGDPVGGGSLLAIVGPAIADNYALLHDPERAAQYVAMSDPNDETAKAEALLLQGYAALARGDGAAAIAPLKAFDRDWLADAVIHSNGPDQACFLGLAYGLAGDLANAELAFRQVSEPWSRCYAFRGDVLAHAGDAPGAQRVWAEGIRLLPDLPNVYLARGQWELEHGDLDEASADLSTSSAKAPHYADPLKAWGDLLARQGRWKEAVEKYSDALKYAPAWAELHQAMDTARKAGRITG